MNSGKRNLWVKINRADSASPNPLIPNRIENELPIGPYITINGDGKDIGLELVRRSDGTCFDQDFRITGWRESQYMSTVESAIGQMNENRNLLESGQKSQLSKMQTLATENVKATARIEYHHSAKIQQSVKAHTPIDCPMACDAGNGLTCPIRGFPPDQDKLRATRDKLREPLNAGEYSPTGIYSIFGLSKSACERSDVQVANNKLFNQGKYCAFPMRLQQNDPQHSLAIHFPTDITGSQQTRGNNASGIAFASGSGMPILLFTDPNLNASYGGSIIEALGSDKGVYYQTLGGCIFVGLR
jgi:hypothetical protein